MFESFPYFPFILLKGLKTVSDPVWLTGRKTHWVTGNLEEAIKFAKRAELTELE